MEIKNKVFYLSGINGIGMSAIAKMLNELNAVVKGSDIIEKPITKELREKGIIVNLEQVSKNITKDIDYFVYSTAVSHDNEEYVKAKELNIPILKRGEMLSYIFNRFENSIAIAGTHGKTTTSSMFAVGLKSVDPYFAIGGIVKEYNNNMHLGSSNYFIAEADESDNSFLYLNPRYGVITNIEIDHIEHHHSFGNILNSFNQFIENTEEIVVVNKDCNNISKYIDFSNKKIRTYSLNDKNADIYAKDIYLEDDRTTYTVCLKGMEYKFVLTVPGLHNVSNSLPVIYILLEKGINVFEIQDNLKKFEGANRRFQILYNEEYKVIDDYGHHPTEINATIEATRNKYKGYKLNLIFEPHRYTRTNFFKDEFIEVLKKSDNIYLLPIYSASEKNEFNISSEDLKKEIEKENENVYLIDYENAINKLKKEEKNVYLFMGAGNVTKLAHEFVEGNK